MYRDDDQESDQKKLVINNMW